MSPHTLGAVLVGASVALTTTAALLTAWWLG